MESKNINDYTVFFGAKDAGNKFKVILSKLIKNKFAEPYDESSIKDVIDFSLKYYSKEFETICKKETSYEFYKLIFWLHEQSVELRRDEKIIPKLNDIIGQDYFSIYRRVLKLILEEACLINLIAEELNPTFKERAEKIFDDLMFLGDEIFTLASLLAEQAMIGDVVAIEFTEGGIYKLKRKHFFDLAFEKIVNLDAYKPNSFVTDKNAEADFIKAVKESFDVNFHDVMGIIDGLFNHRKLKKWTALAIGNSERKVAMKKFYSVPEESTESFLSGLYFSKDQKISIKEVIRKPYQINRFLNRPLLIWNIDGKDYCVIGKHSITEAMNSLFHNAFPWNKAPKEWEGNPIFRTFLAKKEREHEKMLLDKVEDEIKSTTLIYQPNVKKLKIKKGTIDIQNEQCGEIDFLVINSASKKIFVIECKHLLGRYDMANFYIDYNSMN